jgi:hypothetical protein
MDMFDIVSLRECCECLPLQASIALLTRIDIQTELPHVPLLILVTSTHGRGDPPPAMQGLWQAMLRANLPKDILEGTAPL